MRDMITISFRCSRSHAAALERAGTAEVLRQLVAVWAEQIAADQFVAAYENCPVDGVRQIRIPSAMPEPW